VTSQIAHDPATVAIERGNVTAGFMPKDSEARITKLFTLHSSLIVKRLCRLKSEKKDPVLQTLRSFFQ